MQRPETWHTRGPPRTPRGGSRRVQLSEARIQAAIIEHLERRGRGVAFHVPNGGARNKAEAARFKAQGVRAGVPDVLIFHAGKAYALELKSERGRVSPAQQSMLERLAAEGVTCSVAHGVDEAIGTLSLWGLLK